ncbi:MAG: hypothetical protein ABJM26_03665 [Anderseniella sp.]
MTSEAMGHSGIVKLGWLSLSNPTIYARAGKQANLSVFVLFAASLVLFIVADLLGPLLLSPVAGEFINPLQWTAMFSSVLLWSIIAAFLFAVAWVSRKAHMWFIEDMREIGLSLFALGVLFLILKPLVYVLGLYAYTNCASSEYFQTHVADKRMCWDRVGDIYLFLPLAMIALSTRLFRGIAPEPGVMLAFLTAVALVLTFSFGPSIISSVLS